MDVRQRRAALRGTELAAVPCANGQLPACHLDAVDGVQPVAFGEGFRRLRGVVRGAAVGCGLAVQQFQRRGIFFSAGNGIKAGLLCGFAPGAGEAVGGEAVESVGKVVRGLAHLEVAVAGIGCPELLGVVFLGGAGHVGHDVPRCLVAVECGVDDVLRGDIFHGGIQGLGGECGEEGCEGRRAYGMGLVLFHGNVF